MNLILFDADELDRPLARTDPRAQHLCEVLRRQPGDRFDVGMVNGPRGKGTLVSQTDQVLELSFVWGPMPPPLDPLTLVLGLPRPQTARKVLQEATTLGVEALHFVQTERAEAQYAQSSLWSSGEWRRHVLAGVAQAFDTRVPKVTWGRSLSTLLDEVESSCDGTTGVSRIALDNYEASVRLGACEVSPVSRIWLALGPERGWGPADRSALREHGFVLAHLGERVLRAETAVVASLAILRSRAGWI
ncbi:MAG: RsmE family RNA methyltransferase [Opitutaceae bacterium]